MGKFFEQALSLFGDNTNKSSQKSDAASALQKLWQKARYRFEFEASVCEEGKGDLLLRLQGMSDVRLVHLLYKAGTDLSQADFGRCYSVIEDTQGVPDKEVRPIADIRTYRFFDDFPFVASGEPFDTNRRSRSVIIYIGYTLRGQQGYTLVHLHPWGRRDTHATVMANISIYTSVGEEEAKLNRCLFVFDEDTSLRVQEEFMRCQKAAMQKAEGDQPLTENETLALNADHRLDYYWASAKSKMEHGRWSDALMQWMYLYRFYNEAAHENFHKELADNLFRLAGQIGRCHYHRGQYELAKSYLDFSEYDNEDNPEREACMQECFDRLNRAQPSSLLGYLCGDILQLVPEELSNLLWIDNDTLESSRVDDLNAIWDFDLKALMAQRRSATLCLSYNRMGCRPFERQISAVSGPHIDDCSIYFPNRSLIIQLTREESVVQLSVLMPPGQLFDNNLPTVAKTVSLEFTLLGEWPTEQFEELRAMAENKRQQKEELSYYEFYSLGRFPEIRKDFIIGCEAFNNKIFGDALVYLSRAFRALSREWDHVELDPEERGMYGELSYMLGFIYMDLGQYAYALYYLEPLSQSADSKWKIEYINALVNSRDIRAYSYVYKELKEATAGADPEEKEYLNFLKRRYGYLLIEFHDFYKARTYFQSLLDDPDCGKFAQSELDYLESRQ